MLYVDIYLEEYIIKQEEARYVRQLLSGLNLNDRKIFILYYYNSKKFLKLQGFYI